MPGNALRQDPKPPETSGMMSKMEGWRLSIQAWVLRYLQQGLTPGQLALSLSLGMVLGVFPALGTTSLLCLLASLNSKVNQPAMQSVNFVVYPLQFLLLIPFYRLGATLFHDSDVKWTLSAVRHLIGTNVAHAVDELWMTTWHAIAAWALIAPFAVAIIYFVLVRVLRRLQQAM